MLNLRLHLKLQLSHFVNVLLQVKKQEVYPLVFFDNCKKKVQNLATFPFIFMKKSLALLSLLIVSACTTAVPEDTTENSLSSSSVAMSTSSVSSEVVQTLQGTVETIGISVYMEGTHKLLLQDGTFILLQSDAVDLNGYVAERVAVTGTVHATVEADGLIMNVDSIVLSSSSSSSVSPESASVTSVSLSSTTSVAAPVSSSTQATSLYSSIASIYSAPSSTVSVQSISAPTVPQVTTDDPVLRTLASADYSPAKWTSEYCSKAEPFCIPIHKSWWYQGYLGTATDRLSIEVSSVEILNKGEGKLVVRLLTGSVDSVGAVDGEIKKVGTTIIGYKAWTNNRRFEITGHETLQTPIQYLLQNLKSVAN